MTEPAIRGERTGGNPAGSQSGSIAAKSEVGIVSVNVGLPRVIGRLRDGEPVVSGIVKRPVAADELFLDALNLEGDRQADRRVHGGPDKAVYAYPTEHLPRWTAEMEGDPPFSIGTFGENLSTAGWTEAEIQIGDVWAWGEALVTRRPAIGRRLVRSGRSGWYLRVLRPGRVPVAGPIRVAARDAAGVTVLDAHRASLPGATREEIERVAAVAALADDWRWGLTQELARLDRR